MVAGAVEYREIRFVIGEEQTDVYILCHVLGDCSAALEGWHHKIFPLEFSILGIAHVIFLGQEDPVLWPLQAPQKRIGSTCFS